MLVVGANFSSLALGAGEPFLLQVAFQEADGSPSDISARAFVLTFYKANRQQVFKIDGEPSADGSFLRFEQDGSFSESQYNQGLLFELSERLKGGRSRIANGSLTIGATASGVASLDNGPVGYWAVRVVYKRSAAGSDQLVFSQSDVPYEAPSVTPPPTPAPTVVDDPTITSDGTPQVGETMTGNSGTYQNGTVASRAWLLNGSAISGANGATYVPQATGSLVYREVVSGAGGSIDADSDPVTVAAATPTPTPSAFFGSSSSTWGSSSPTFGATA